jgi:hypothetical protein
MDDAVDPRLIETSVDISRPIDGGVDVLRQFSASIGHSVESGLDEIGFVSGWIGWRIDDEDLLDAADAICSDAERLGSAAAAIIDAHPDAFIDNVLLIDRMHLAPQWRGNRLSGAIIADLLSLLRLDADATSSFSNRSPKRPPAGRSMTGQSVRRRLRDSCLRIGQVALSHGASRSSGGFHSDRDSAASGT